MRRSYMHFTMILTLMLSLRKVWTCQQMSPVITKIFSSRQSKVQMHWFEPDKTGCEVVKLILFYYLYSPSCLLISVCCHWESKQTILISFIYNCAPAIKIEPSHEAPGEVEQSEEGPHDRHDLSLSHCHQHHAADLHITHFPIMNRAELLLWVNPVAGESWLEQADPHVVYRGNFTLPSLSQHPVPSLLKIYSHQKQ